MPKPPDELLPELIDKIIPAIEADEYLGFCLLCGNEQGECEPDAENYVCENCGKSMVFGAEQILVMYEDQLS